MWPTRLECFNGLNGVGRWLESSLTTLAWAFLCLLCCSSQAWSLELEAPAEQRIKPGAWLSLAFVVTADEQPRWSGLDPATRHHEPKIDLPLGWTLVVPPRQLDLTHHKPQTLTLAVAVPADAPAGRHAISLTIGPWSVAAEVMVETVGRIEWVGDAQSDQVIHRWWSDRPWSVDEAVVLVGNQSLTVRLKSKAPEGVLVALSEQAHRLVPGVAQHMSIEVRRDPNSGQLPKRLAIAVDVLDANTGKHLATRRWVLAPFNDDMNPSSPRPWNVGGFVDWRLNNQANNQPNNQSDNQSDMTRMIEPHDWGILGSGDLDEASQARVAFAWHQDTRWGRYVEFDSPELQWRVGHRVFLGQRIDGLSRSGKGFNVSWQSDQTDGAWRMGWIDFMARSTHYQSPWWSWGGWRLATINASSNHPDTQGLGRWWSLAYQSPRATTSQASPMHQWTTQFTGNKDRVASRIKYRYQSDHKAWLGFLAESIPKDHVSGLPAGKRLLIQSHQPIHTQSHLTALVSAGQQKSIHGTTHHQAIALHHWQSISRAGRIRLGLGGTHRRHRRVSFNSNLADQFRTHESALSIRWTADWNGWHGSGRLDTRGRLGLATRFDQRHLGTWRLSHQNTYTQLSLSSNVGPWRWLGAVEKHRSGPERSLINEARLGLDAEADEGLVPRTDAARWRFGLQLSRRVGRLQEWSLALSPDTTDWAETTVWLRYRWRAHIASPMLAVTRVLGPLLGQDQRHVISGQVQKLTPAGRLPIEGVVVSLNDRHTRTDALGRYRFVGVGLGAHHLAIEPWLNNASTTQTAHIGQDWVLSAKDSVDVWVDANPLDSDRLISEGAGSLDRSLTHDWLWVRPGDVVVDVIWPQESPVDHSTQSLVMEKMRLVGICQTCPSAHQRRTAKRNAQGQWVVSQLLPGRWQWQWVGALLPSEHALKEPIRSIDVLSGQTKKMTWEVGYRPHPIEWQRTQSVELRD